MRIAHPSYYRSLILISSARRRATYQSPCFTSPISNPVLLPQPKPGSPSKRRVVSTSMASANDDNEEYGFRRSEMYQSNLAGTVGAYDRHVFLCYKSPEAWASRVEDSESDPLPKLLASALKARKNDITLKVKLRSMASSSSSSCVLDLLCVVSLGLTCLVFCNLQTKLTICEGRDGTEFSDGDVLIFPEMVKYRYNHGGLR